MLAQPIDARSNTKDFNDYMREKKIIDNFPSSFAKDHHYSRHGFDFIKTEDDIEQFLTELDNAPVWYSPKNGECTKASRIRGVLSRPDDIYSNKIERFKAKAAYIRRTCCSCHETGSYSPNIGSV